MADLTSVAPMLKEVWPDSFETAYSQEIVGTARIEKTSEGIQQDMSGRYVVVPMKVRRNQGIGSRAERAILPLPGKQGYVGTRVTMRYQYGIGDITLQGLKLADREPRSFVNLLDQEMSGLRDDVMKDYARQFYGDGTGTLATVTDITGAPTLVVDSIQFFEEDMVIDAVDESGPTVTADGMTIVSVDEAAKTITVDDATGVADTNVIVRSGDYNQEINGVGAFLGTDEVQNLDAATEPKWHAPVYTAGAARAYDEMLLIKALDAGRRKSGKFASVIFTSFGGRRAVYNSLSADRQYTNTTEFAHGFKAMPFDYGGRTIPVMEDPDYPGDPDEAETSFTGIHEDTVKVYRDPEGWHFAEETGSMFIAKQDRSDAWEFRIRQISQIGISQRNAHWKVDRITNVQEDAVA